MVSSPPSNLGVIQNFVEFMMGGQYLIFQMLEGQRLMGGVKFMIGGFSFCLQVFLSFPPSSTIKNKKYIIVMW